MYLKNDNFNYDKEIKDFYFYENEIINDKFKISYLLINENSKKNKIFKKINVDLDLFQNIEYNASNVYIKNREDFFISNLIFIIMKSLLFDSKIIIDDFKKKPTNGHSDSLINISIDLYKKFIFYYQIKNKKNLNIEEKNVRYIFSYMLILLAKYKIITHQKKNINNKSYIFYFLFDAENKTYVYNLNHITSFEKFKYFYCKESKNAILYSKHWSLTTIVFKKNDFSNKEITLLKEETIESILELYIYIDVNQLKNIYESFLVYNALDDASLEKNYLSYLNQNQILLKNNNIKAVSELSNKISTIQSAIKIKNIIKKKIENIKIFLPFFFDFRGRLYFSSEYSPTFYKYLRYCIHWGDYGNIKKDYNSHSFNIIIENELKKYHYLIDNWNYLKKQENIYVKNAIIWILISASETKKTLLGECVNIEKFIKEGIFEIENFQKNKIENLDTYWKIQHAHNIIYEINRNIFKKWLISKDATASVYQHLIKTIGINDIDDLKWVNLSSLDTWYDTYSLIIKKYKNSINLKFLTKEEFDLFFNRKTLKKVIMTYNYGVGLISAKKYYNNEIKKINENLSDDKMKEILYIFIKFFEYLEEPFLTQYPSNRIFLYFIKKKNFDMELDDAIIFLDYYKTKKKQIEIYVDGERFTKKEKLITTDIDNKKIKTSIRANYVHTLDAAYARWFLMKNKAITIHDCFMIDYINITFLISKTNEGMRIIFHDIGLEKKYKTDNLFSIFILL